jgi:dihydrosphingosine 1-phosphate phosphatase
MRSLYGDRLDAFIAGGSWWTPIVVITATVFLVRVHPEPADACCKCFEDGVAFAGVFVGVKIGQWRNPVSRRPPQQPYLVPMSLNIIKILIMIVSGNLLRELC